MHGRPVDPSGNDLHGVASFAPSTHPKAGGPIEKHPMPGKEHFHGKRFLKRVPDSDHQFAHPIGQTTVDGLKHRIEAQMISDRRHHRIPLENLPLDSGGLDGFGDHEIKHRFGPEFGRQALHQSSDPPRMVGKSEQGFFQSTEGIAEFRPVGLLPIVAHEPNMAHIRLKK